MFGLNLLVLRCADPDRARQFYECFGLSFERHRHGTGPEHWAAAGAGGVFELYPATTAGQADGTGLGFAVADLAGTAAALATRGFEPGAIADRPWGRTFVVREARRAAGRGISQVNATCPC